MPTFDLTSSIRSIHKRLVAQLEDRRQIPHSTTKGDEGEQLWLKVLQDHLPRRYAIRKGIVIDSRGRRSDALDLIIYDPQYTPVFLAHDEHAYVFAEAVYAVFEVKYELTSKSIEYAADKAKSVRQLHRTNAPIHHAGGEIREPRTPFRLLAGLLSLSHDWKETSLEEKLREHTEKCQGDRVLDLNLCLQAGLFESQHDESERMGADPTFEPGSASFVSFLFSLLHRLQRRATVPAVDWTEYRALVRNLAQSPR